MTNGDNSKAIHLGRKWATASLRNPATPSGAKRVEREFSRWNYLELPVIARSF
jgi:hypothetical protein